MKENKNDRVFDKYESLGAYHWKAYDAKKRKSYKNRVDALMKIFDKVKEKESALDIGCGDAFLTYKLAELGFKKVVGIDTNSTAIELGNKQEKMKGYVDSGVATVVHKSFSGLNRQVKYSHVLCHEVIEHVPDPKKLLLTIKEICTDFAIVTTPNRQYNSPDKYDYNMWYKKEFEALLDSAGLKYEFIVKGKFFCVKIDLKK